jgi:tetratricopeptide (TPR) repeat protein
MSTIEQLVLEAKTSFQAKDYEACISLTDEALRADPGNKEASWLMKEAQRQWEDQRSLEQLEIYVENLKKEAMDLFDQEQYEQCLGMFRFLSELEPENHTLRDYVKLSQQMFVESIGSKELAVGGESGSSSDSDFKKLPKVLNVGSQPPESSRSSTSAATVVPGLDGTASDSALGTGLTRSQGGAPNDPVQPDSLSGLQGEGSRSDGGRENQAGQLPAEIRTLGGMTSLATTRPPKTEEPKALVLEGDAIPRSVKRKIIQEFASAMQARRRRSLNVRLMAALFLVTAAVTGCFWLYASFLTPFLASRIEIQSTPERAAVFIDNNRVGETPFQQRGMPAGSHALRIEKQGYQPYNRELWVEHAQGIILVVQLEKSKARAASTTQVQPEVPREPPVQAPAPQSVVLDPVEPEAPAVQISQSVIHHHVLGSCTGRLKIDGDKISFWSPGNSRDTFTRKIAQITSFGFDDKLLVEFKDKAYRFEALARYSKNARARLTPFYEQIKLQKLPARGPS